MAKLAIVVTLAAAVSLGAQPRRAAGDEVPTLDIRTNCRTHTPPDQTGDTERACLAGEQNARESLAKEWTHYAAQDKARCTRMVTSIAGFESYVELYACLRAAEVVKGLPKD